MKFLLDENVHRGLSFFLSEQKHGVKLTPKSIDDKEVFKLALSEQRLLITRDKHFTQEPYFSSEHFGIWLLRIAPGDLETQKSKISKLLNQFSAEELKTRIIELTPEVFEFVK